MYCISIAREIGAHDIFNKEFSPSLLALLLISVAFGAADGFGMAEIKIAHS